MRWLLLLLLAVAGTVADCPASLAGLSAAQLSAIEPSCFAGLSYLSLERLPDAACSGFTAAQLRLIATAVPFDACEGFSPACLRAVPDVSQLSWRCLVRLNVLACPALSSAQLDSLLHGESLRGECVESLSAGQCAGLVPSGGFLGRLGSDVRVPQCGRLRPACLAAVPRFDSVSPGCWQQLQGPNCASFSATQTASLSPATAAIVSAACVAQLPDASCAALPWASLAPAACGAVSASCVSKSSLASLSTQCAAQFPGPACAGITAVNAGSIPPGAISSDCAAMRKSRCRCDFGF
jgi:hypothetical protein